jgi:hypothetical protein
VREASRLLPRDKSRVWVASISNSPTTRQSARYSVTVPTETGNQQRQYAGLCADCRFMRRMKSDRGSTFYFCEKSVTDPAFPKYPRLPVLQCSGYERIVGEGREDPGL